MERRVPETVRVFFYGLFMDEQLLSGKGIKPFDVSAGFVDGYGLRIGKRATLVRSPGSRACGVVMDIAPGEAADLYAEESLADYLPEPETIELMDGTQVEATCYNLPLDKVTGTNREHAASLLTLAARPGVPDEHLDQIRQALCWLIVISATHRLLPKRVVLAGRHRYKYSMPPHS